MGRSGAIIQCLALNHFISVWQEKLELFEILTHVKIGNYLKNKACFTKVFDVC